MYSEWPRGLLIDIFIVLLYQEDLDEMYLPDDQGEYAPKSGVQNFSVQGLSDALMPWNLRQPWSNSWPKSMPYCCRSLWLIDLGTHTHPHSLGTPVWSYMS